jgi:hypothetical protein
MAKPVWILLPHLSDWRWMQQTDATPWYPTALLLRQSAPGDWAGLVERVIGELGDLQAARIRVTPPQVIDITAIKTSQLIPV